MALWMIVFGWAKRSGWLLPLLTCVLSWAQVGCGSGRDMSSAHGSLRARSDCIRCHQDDQGRMPTSPAKCLDCHSEIGSRRTEHRGLHALGLDGTPRSGSQVRRAGLCPDVTREAPDFTQLCGSCHHEHAGTVLVTWGSLEGCDPPERFQERHAELTGFALTGKHAKAPCGSCHKDLPSGRRTYLTAQPACQSCHASVSPHGPMRDDGCQRCHSDAGWSPQIPFDHQKETQYPLVGMHHKAPCTGCHKDRSFRMTVEQYADCSPCHSNPHGTRFNGQLQCSFCHTPNSWGESVFDHGKRTRFLLTGGHAAPKQMDCRRCHRGEGKSDFEDLRGLVTGSKGPFPISCAGCHEHAEAHGGDVRLRQCLICHDPGQEELKPDLNIKKMTYVGHPPGRRFPLTGGHALARMKDKSYCTACHRNVSQGFEKLSTACFSCHKGTDQERGHRGVLGKQCDDCHDSGTGTWKDTARFKHELRFPLVGAHLRPAACTKCHQGDSLATAFKPRSAKPRLCGNAECHKAKVKKSKHGDKYGEYCGDRAGCHNPLHGRFVDPETLEGTNP